MAFNNTHFPNGLLPPQAFSSFPPNPFLHAGPSNYRAMNPASASSTSGSDDAPAGLMGDPRFQIFDWYPAYQSCQRYFLDHAQYEGGIQAVAALVNIRLPFQWSINPIMSSQHAPAAPAPPAAYPGQWHPGPSGRPSPQNPGNSSPSVSLVPYIRRLVVTGMDNDGILHGFFGNEWAKGIGPFQECERRNYLFAAKGIGMARTKAQYDMNPHETVPFMRPLANAKEPEIQAAEKVWSDWLTMEDWMLGERAPDQMQPERESNVSSRS